MEKDNGITDDDLIMVNLEQSPSITICYYKMIKRIIAVTLLLIGFLQLSCRQSPVDISEIAGTYIFTYPSGEVETLTINEDFTYRKDIYSEYKKYKKKSAPDYSNYGRWLLLDRNELTIYHWLMYNELRYPDKILPTPIVGTMNNVYWENSIFRRWTRISVYYESGKYLRS